MVKFGSLCVVISLLVVGISHCRSVKIGFTLFEQLSDDYYIRLRDSLETTRNNFSNPLISGVAGGVSAAATLVSAATGNPFPAILAKLVAFIPLLVTVLADKSDWKGNFFRALKNRDEITEAKDVLREIRNKLSSKFSNHLRHFNETTDEELKAHLTRVMDSDLSEIIGYFNQPDSPLRDLPEIAAPMLLAISPIIANAMLNLKKHDPDYRQNSHVACYLKDNLQEYFLLTLLSRLNKIEVYSTLHGDNTYDSVQYHIHSPGPPSGVQYVWEAIPSCVPYNETEYDKFKTSVIREEGSTEWDRFQKEYSRKEKKVLEYTVVRDQLGEKDNFFGDSGFMCSDEYFKIVRERLEREFSMAYEVANNQCHEFNNTYKRTPTGRITLLNKMHIIYTDHLKHANQFKRFNFFNKTFSCLILLFLP